MDAELARRLEIGSGKGRVRRMCSSFDGPYREYKRLDDGTWVDLGACTHEHPKVDWEAGCGKTPLLG